MTFPKWHKAGRQNRVFIQPVINLPPPEVIVQQSPVTPAPKPAAASRIWSAAKVVGPAVISVTALFISLLTYTDQHHADQAAAAATLRHDAEQVSFTNQVSPGPPSSIVTTIENTSTSMVLLGLDHSSLAVPRSFRVYSGSWKLPRDRSHRAGDGPRPVRAGSGLALGF